MLKRIIGVGALGRLYLLGGGPRKHIPRNGKNTSRDVRASATSEEPKRWSFWLKPKDCERKRQLGPGGPWPSNLKVRSVFSIQCRAFGRVWKEGSIIRSIEILYVNTMLKQVKLWYSRHSLYSHILLDELCLLIKVPVGSASLMFPAI